MPVTSAAGVTSKAGFATGVVAGAMATSANLPAASSPRTLRISSAARSSIGICMPSAMPQSIVGVGTHA
jgi:hypothetical protein